MYLYLYKVQRELITNSYNVLPHNNISDLLQGISVLNFPLFLSSERLSKTAYFCFGLNDVLKT